LGNLDLRRAIWPKTSRISGADLDVLARRHLWLVKIIKNFTNLTNIWKKKKYYFKLKKNNVLK
jgi:hypothetical protein